MDSTTLGRWTSWISSPISAWFAQPGWVTMTRTHSGARRVLVVDADPALLGLLEEWLGEQGCRVVADGSDEAAKDGFDLAVVDVPFPRHGGLALLKHVSEAHPGVPILALSSNFFAGIAN